MSTDMEDLKGAQSAQPGQKRKRNATRGVGQNSPFQAKRQKILSQRRSLPIWPRKHDILEALNHSDVLVLTGETGSGKSTQVPQFLQEAAWCTGKIAVTQPRQVAAINLARRVADEMGTPLGRSSPASTVGYSVRFDNNTSASTRIKYLTEGMLLQEMLRDPTLGQYSCVIVDEVHERSVDVDLTLGFLKQLLVKNRKKPLKVVVMSATANTETLSNFFAGNTGAQVTSGRVSGEDENEKVSEQVNPDEKPLKVAQCHVEGRQYPVNLHYLDRPSNDYMDSALQRLFQIHCKEPMPGDVLVFLDGSEAINNLQKNVEEFAKNLTAEFPKILVLPLYAALPSAAQQRIFERAPPNTRKVILSTNIAETSVTVPGVRFVVDSGRFKKKQFRSRLGLESLLTKPVSKSSAEQRKGRAGREAPGQCYRLFTKETYDTLATDTKPEILDCDLSNAVLKMKARGVDDIINFPYLTPPSRDALGRSLFQLHDINCIDDTGRITETGRKVARLPLTPQLGVVLLEAAKSERDCLLEVIDIVSCLSVENIFIATHTEETREEALQARSQLHRRQGDHLTLLAAIQGYAAENADRKRWAEKHLISHRAMKAAMDVRKQLTEQSKPLLPPGGSFTIRSTIDEATQDNILKSFLRGFKNNVAVLCPDKTYKMPAAGGAGERQTVTIHPSSVLFGAKREAIMFDRFVYTQKPYAREVSGVQIRWLNEMYGFDC